MPALNRDDIAALAQRLASHAGIFELKQSEAADLKLAAAALNNCVAKGFYPLTVPHPDHPTRSHPETD